MISQFLMWENIHLVTKFTGTKEYAPKAASQDSRAQTEGKLSLFHGSFQKYCMHM